MRIVQKRMKNCSNTTAQPEKTIWLCSFLLAAFVMLSLCAPDPGFAWREKPEDVIEKSCGDNNSNGKKILIAYDTEHGSTATITERIADVLCQEGYQVDLAFAPNVEDVSAYDAVIAGSPIYEFKWLFYAKMFLFRFQKELSEKDVAVFITCTYIVNDTEERRDKAIDLYFKPVLMWLPNIKPISYGIMAGDYWYDELYPLERFKMKNSPESIPKEGDYRDWNKIEAWAYELADLLK